MSVCRLDYPYPRPSSANILGKESDLEALYTRKVSCRLKAITTLMFRSDWLRFITFNLVFINNRFTCLAVRDTKNLNITLKAIPCS